MTKQQKIAQALKSAIALHQSGQIEQAIALYREVLALDSRHLDANHLLGLAQHQLGQDDQAIPLFNRALMLQPNNPVCLANFAELWRKQKNLPNAIDCYRKVLAITPGDHSIRQLLGEALVKLGKYEEALVEFEKIIQAGQATADTWWGMSEVLRQVDRLEEAVAASRRATQMNPNSEGAWHSLGWNLVRTGKVREALPYFNRAIELAPNEPLLFWRRAWALLLLGDYEHAWADYESRWHDEELQLKDRRDFPGPQWTGQDIAGKTVFIHLEQGVGDTIQFVRYVPMVQARGAKVVLECHPSFATLFARSFPGVQLFTEGGQVPPYEFHTPLLSLPHAFRTTLATVPADVPYIRSDPSAVEAWRSRMATEPGLKVGLVWAGSAAHKNDRHRSIRLERLAPLAQVPGVRLVSLQKGPGAEQASQFPAMHMLDWTAELNDWDATAALISALDLVISVDTSVAHMAGALARPTWTLLPFAPDFRWMIDREDTPWYPTMRLFRQPSFKEWDSVIQSVSQQLRQLASDSKH